MEKTQMVEWTHPDFGTCLVIWRWEPVDDVPGCEATDVMHWVPIGAEFDLFTPDDVQRDMLHELAVCKLLRERPKRARPPNHLPL